MRLSPRCELKSEDEPRQSRNAGNVVCAQIGCPLCSMISCAYTKYAGTTTVIAEAESDERDITVVCKSLK